MKKVILPIDNYMIVCDFAFSEDNIQTIPINHLSMRDFVFSIRGINLFDTYKKANETIKENISRWERSNLYSQISNIRIMHRDVQWYELKESDKITWHEKVLGF